MVIKCSDETLRGMVRDAMSLRDDVNDVSHYAGYYIIAEYFIAEHSESAREICVAINKWHEKDRNTGKVYRWFDIGIVCDEINARETIWSDWVGTETQDFNELFNLLKEIRDGITEKSFCNNDESKD